MTNQTNNKRLLAAVQSIENRLKSLPILIRNEFRASANRQVNALHRVEQTVETVTRLVERQRSAIERALADK